MKQLLFALTTFAATLSFAYSSAVRNDYTRNYSITSAKFAKSHLAYPGVGTVTLDYKNSKVTINVQYHTPCDTKICPHSIGLMVVELPITAITTDSCGIHHVTASKDERPVDGGLQKITVLDPSEITCMTFVAVLPEAKYQTRYVSRMTGKDIVATSSMVLQQLNPNSIK